MHPDEKVLSLGDVLLRRSDVDLLTGPHWLNDQVTLNSIAWHISWKTAQGGCMSGNAERVLTSAQIISFYFEMLTRNGDGNLTMLLPGSTTFLLLHGGAS